MTLFTAPETAHVGACLRNRVEGGLLRNCVDTQDVSNLRLDACDCRLSRRNITKMTVRTEQTVS